MPNTALRSKIFDAIDNLDSAALANTLKVPAHANLNYKDTHQSLLCKAVSLKSTELVAVLLDNGADPNTLFNQSTRVREYRGASGMYFSPLATAVREEYQEIALMLMRKGARTDLPFWVKYIRDGSSGISMQDVRTIRDLNPEFVKTLEECIELEKLIPANAPTSRTEVKSL